MDLKTRKSARKHGLERKIEEIKKEIEEVYGEKIRKMMEENNAWISGVLHLVHIPLNTMNEKLVYGYRLRIDNTLRFSDNEFAIIYLNRGESELGVYLVVHSTPDGDFPLAYGDYGEVRRQLLEYYYDDLKSNEYLVLAAALDYLHGLKP